MEKRIALVYAGFLLQILRPASNPLAIRLAFKIKDALQSDASWAIIEVEDLEKTSPAKMTEITAEEMQASVELVFDPNDSEDALTLEFLEKESAAIGCAWFRISAETKGREVETVLREIIAAKKSDLVTQGVLSTL